MSNLATGYAESGRLDEALRLLDEAIRIAGIKLGPDHPDTLIMMYKQAEFSRYAGRADRSAPMIAEVFRLRERKLGRTHPETLRALAELGVNDKDAGRLTEALPRLEEAYRARRSIPNSHRFGVELLDGYARAGRSAEADALAVEIVAEARQARAKGRWQPLADALDQVGRNRLRAGTFAEAEPPLRECLEIRAKALPADWKTLNTRSLLGGALLGQKKYAEAEPMLRQGGEGMKALEKVIPPIDRPRLAEAVDRLIALYTATNRPDEVRKWRAERARYGQDAGSTPGATK
jgi:tetratricopeptide (TPR) repeat protein